MDTGSGHTDSSAGGIDGSVRTRALGPLFFIGIALLYFSLSPLTFRMMGYMEEEVQASRQVLAKLRLISHPSFALPMTPTRNGAAPLVVHAPFILLSHWLFGPSAKIEDAFLALQPVLLTAGIVTLLFLWGSRLSRSWWWGFVLAVVGGFATLLWPYAYIGLETQQTFFLLLAAYIALEKREQTGIGWLLLFLFSAAMAVGVKSTGAFLLPAVVCLVFAYGRRSAAPLPRIALGLAAVAASVLLAAYTRSFFWEGIGGSGQYLRFWLVRDVISYGLNNVGFLASVNKGLLVFAPPLILALAAVPRLVREREPVALFAGLTLAGLMGGYSLLTCWADENWGPRYLHSAVPPLILCIAAAKRGMPLRWRSSAAILLFAAAGFLVSGLGALFWYGSLHQVATATQQNALEWLHGDLTWNHIKFNGRLFRVWMKPDDARDTAWTPSQTWYFAPPESAPQPTSVDLKRMLDLNGRPTAVPQSFFFQRAAIGATPFQRLVSAGLAISFLLGCAILGVSGARAYFRT